MSGISTSTEAVYMPCYHINLSAKKATLGKYNYTEMMKKAAQQPDDNITYYETDKYGRVFVDPAHPSRATLESADNSGIPLPDLSSVCMPGCRMDFQSWTLTPDPNYFSDLLARQSELAKSGESQLTQQEIEELSGKCDMTQMLSQEYKDLVNYLADKGVIDRPEPLRFDPGEPVRIKGGQAWLESAGTPQNTGTPGIAQFLHPSLTERYNRLLAEQTAANTLQSTGRMDSMHV